MCLWIIPLCNIKYSEECCHCFQFVWSTKQWQNELIKENRTEIKQSRETYLALTCSSAGPASVLAQPTTTNPLTPSSTSGYWQRLVVRTRSYGPLLLRARGPSFSLIPRLEMPWSPSVLLLLLCPLSSPSSVRE